MTATIVPERLAELDDITLDRGPHKMGSGEYCAVEFADYLAGGRGSDQSTCISAVIREYVIALNDSWDVESRQRLKPYLPRMVGTAGDGQDKARSYLALDWLVRVYAPAWLSLAGLTREADELSGLASIAARAAAEDAARAATRVAARAAALDAARAAARAAVRDATRVAARDAAWADARDAAWAAARDAAWAAARDAARAAALAAAWDATRVAARAATRDATRDATRVAARAAARAAALDAAWDALWPTVKHLQASALDLLDRMIDPSGATS